MIDAYVRVSLVGIELLTIDARIVIASVDTYLRFAEATNRLDLSRRGGKALDEFIGNMQERGAPRSRAARSGRQEGAHRAATTTTTTSVRAKKSSSRRRTENA